MRRVQRCMRGSDDTGCTTTDGTGHTIAGGWTGRNSADGSCPHSNAGPGARSQIQAAAEWRSPPDGSGPRGGGQQVLSDASCAARVPVPRDCQRNPRGAATSPPHGDTPLSLHPSAAGLVRAAHYARVRLTIMALPRRPLPQTTDGKDPASRCCPLAAYRS